MKVLLIPDRPGWAYADIARSLQKHTPPDVTVDIVASKDSVPAILAMEHEYDRLLWFGWQQLEGIPHYRVDKGRWLTGIHSHHAFDPDLKTTPEYDVLPPNRVLRLLSRFRSVNAVSRRLTNLFRPWLDVTYTPNGIDTERFKPLNPIMGLGAVGTAYNPKHDRRKGVTEFIKPACDKTDMPLFMAKELPPDDMPAFWNVVDVGVLMSSSEGMSIAMLEAMACGRPFISTRVGGATEVITHGVNGYLVDRSVDALAEFLLYLKVRPEKVRAMGGQAREDVEREWAWEKRAAAWWRFILS